MKINKLIEKRKTLFGSDMKDVKRLIICPIGLIFEKFEAEKTSKGWWNVKYIGDVAIVKSPVASHVKDVITYFNNLKEILIIGFCGSISNSMPGEIVRVSHSSFENSTIMANLEFKEFLHIPKKHFYLTKSFSEQEELNFLNILKNKEIDCVDMETYYIFEEIGRLKLNTFFGGIYIVTDHLIKAPFYLCKKPFNDSIQIMLNLVKKYIKNG